MSTELDLTPVALKHLRERLMQEFAKKGYFPFITVNLVDGFVMIGTRVRCQPRLDLWADFYIDSEQSVYKLPIGSVVYECIRMYGMPMPVDIDVMKAYPCTLTQMYKDKMINPLKFKNYLRKLLQKEHQELDNRFSRFNKQLNKICKEK